MAARLILKEHAIDRIKRGDDGGRRTHLKPQQVLNILSNPKAYVSYKGKTGDGRIFFSDIDQKCLVAWLEDCGTYHKVRTIENHHHRVPAPVLLEAEQCFFRNVLFLKRPPASESFSEEYTVWCRMSGSGQKIRLPGYLYPGVSWWRFQKNVKNVANFVHQYDADGTESLILEGTVWHGKKARYVEWADRLPLSFARDLLQAGKTGSVPDFSALFRLNRLQHTL